VGELFAAHGVSATIVEPEPGSDNAAIARQAADEHLDVMADGGGDGTLDAIASAIVCKKDFRFGVLPIGTLNHFARDADIPKDIALAVRNSVVGYTRARGCGRGQWAYISEQLKR